jgi:hypothetical protein
MKIQCSGDETGIHVAASAWGVLGPPLRLSSNVLHITLSRPTAFCSNPSEIRPIYFYSEYRIFHLNPARLNGEIKKDFVAFCLWCFRWVSSNMLAPIVMRLASQWSEYMRLSQRNELSAKICGPHVFRICQQVLFICGDTWRARLTNQILTI